MDDPLAPSFGASVANNVSAVATVAGSVATSRLNALLLDSFQKNRSIQNPAHSVLIALYGCLIVLGTVGNVMVVLAVARKPAMRTARNMFIVNLAVSDLLLCMVTMPLTLMEVLAKYWPLGNHVSLCKMIGTLQATSIFVSTISITAIALDRYQVIVYPTRDNLQCMGAALILLCIWLLALALASPIALVRRLVHSNINLHAFDIHDVVYCVEDWPMQHGRAYYSAFSLFIQYLLPIMIVSAAYTSIYSKLRSRIQIGGSPAASATLVAPAARQPNQQQQQQQLYVDEAQRERKLQRSRRMRRTNCLLCSIAVIFGVSWLPLNLYNLFADIFLAGVPTTQPMLIAYAVCHMMGMSSACSNPFMYGWLNDNFRKEFREILCMDTRAACVLTEHTHARGECERRAAAAAAAAVGGTKATAAPQSQMAMQLLKCDVTAVSGGEATSSMGNGTSIGGGGGATSPRYQADATELTVLVRQ